MNESEQAYFDEYWKTLDVNNDGFVQRKDLEDFFRDCIKRTLEGGHATDAQIEQAYDDRQYDATITSLW